MGPLVPQGTSGSFGGPVHGGVADVVFGALLLVVCLSDLRTRRIPNVLVAGVALSGLVYSAVVVAPLLPGLARAAGACAVGLALWLPFYLLRLIGAGDVKFFAAASTWLGVGHALQAALLAALAGAVLAVIWMGVTGGWRAALTRAVITIQGPASMRPGLRAAEIPGAARIPYGVAMAAGVALSAWIPQLAR